MWKNVEKKNMLWYIKKKIHREEKIVKKLIVNSLIILYMIIAIFLTVLLLSYNDFKVTVIGGNTLIIIRDNELAPEYNKGDLVIVNSEDSVKEGQKVFYYESNDSKLKIRQGTIEEAKQVTSRDIAYTLDGEKKVAGKYIIGATEDAKVIKNAGKVLGILESKWGFLFIIVLPALLLVINQIGVVVSGIKEAKKEE